MNPAIDIAKLSPEERLQLIEQLWESLRKTPESPELTPAQTYGLDRRLDELDNGDRDRIPWDEVLCRIRETG